MLPWLLLWLQKVTWRCYGLISAEKDLAKLLLYCCFSCTTNQISRVDVGNMPGSENIKRILALRVFDILILCMDIFLMCDICWLLKHENEIWDERCVFCVVFWAALGQLWTLLLWLQSQWKVGWSHLVLNSFCYHCSCEWGGNDWNL